MTSKAQKKYLRTLAHERNTILWIGQNGLTDNVLTEINIALDHHELVKIKIRSADREERDRLIGVICEKTGADLIQKTGNVILLYRINLNKPAISFPE